MSADEKTAYFLEKVNKNFNSRTGRKSIKSIKMSQDRKDYMRAYRERKRKETGTPRLRKPAYDPRQYKYRRGRYGRVLDGGERPKKSPSF